MQLPWGWSEHLGPQGQVYYYEAQSGRSTYHPPSPISEASRRKERIAGKEPIPGAEGWLRVTTDAENVFYAHVPSKTSKWLPPDMIRVQVEQMEALARERQEQEVQVLRAAHAEEVRKAEAEARRRAEVARAKKEEARRVRQADAMRVHEARMKVLQAANRKRDRVEEEDGEEGDDKRTKVIAEEGDGDEAEQAWQRSVAAEMAADAQVGDAEGHTPANKAVAVKMAPEDAKAVFVHMLTSLNGTPKEINPMMPWDRESAKFSDHRDYDVLPSLRDREDAFNEWCKLRIREKREAKKEGTTREALAGEASVKVNAASDAYRTLLEGEVTSTRTRWEEFRKAWKRDRRFFQFGRDDREREKAFKEWLRQLGEKKRRVAEAAETAFRQLLDESLDRSAYGQLTDKDTVEQQDAWNRVKREARLDSDARYDAVGSSSRRFELFKEWADKGQSNGTPVQDDGEDRSATRIVKRSAGEALRKREEEVNRQRRRAQQEAIRTSGMAMKEDSRLAFQQLLVDRVHDPLATLPYAFDALLTDVRFTVPGLRDAEREELFFDHMDRLNERRLRALEAVFLRHSPSLNIEEHEALPLVLDDDEVARRSLTKIRSLVGGRSTLANLYREWNGRRWEQGRQEFEQMLKENAFVEFWGRLRQEHEARRDGGETGKEGGEGEEGEEDVPSLLQMAANVDLAEIHAILHHDPRYGAFDHAPDKRSQWIRDHLQRLHAPKKTVFQK